MNKILFLFLFVLFFLPGKGQRNSPEVEAQFNSLDWLNGIWARTNTAPGSTATEKWAIDAPYEFSGFGVTMKGKDTIFIEKIRIIIKDNRLYYVADIRENKAPVNFKFTKITSTGFVCENPDHDFPKKIEYRWNEPNLTVIISGNGKSRDYLFTRR